MIFAGSLRLQGDNIEASPGRHSRQWMKTTVSGPSWPGNYEYGTAARKYLACPEPTQVMANGMGGWSYIPIDLLLYVLYKSGRCCPTPFLITCLDFKQTCPMRVRLAVGPSEISGASRSTPKVRPSKAYLQSNTCLGVWPHLASELPVTGIFTENLEFFGFSEKSVQYSVTRSSKTTTQIGSG